MRFKATILMMIIFTLATDVNAGCETEAFGNNEYLVKSVRGEVKAGLPDLKEIVCVTKRNKVYFQYAKSIGYFTYNTDTTREAKWIDKNYVANTFTYDEINDFIVIGNNEGLFAVDREHRINKILDGSVISVSIQNNTIYYVNTAHEVMVKDVFDKSNDKMVFLDLAQITRLVVNRRFDIIGITEQNEIISLVRGKGMNFVEKNVFGIPTSIAVDNYENMYVYTDTRIIKMDSKGGFYQVSNMPGVQGLFFVHENGDHNVLIGQSGKITKWQLKNINQC